MAKVKQSRAYRYPLVAAVELTDLHSAAQLRAKTSEPLSKRMQREDEEGVDGGYKGADIYYTWAIELRSVWPRRLRAAKDWDGNCLHAKGAN